MVWVRERHPMPLTPHHLLQVGKIGLWDTRVGELILVLPSCRVALNLVDSIAELAPLTEGQVTPCWECA